MAKSPPQTRIKELWEARGKTLEWLAAETGISPGHLSHLASGSRNISLKNMKKIAAALECEPVDLIKPPAPDIESIVLEAWAAIPAGQRETALRVLRSLGDAPVTKRNLETVARVDISDQHPEGAMPPRPRGGAERRKATK